MKLFKRLCFQLGVPFGTLMGIIMGITKGPLAGLGFGGLNGAIFGAVLAFIFTRLQYHGVKKHAGVINEETLVTHQNREITQSKKPFKVFYWTVDALETMRKCTIRGKDEEEGLIEAAMDMSWKTWGEKITIRIKPAEGGKTGITIQSRPLFKYSLVDYGKSHENINKIIAAIEKRTSGEQ